MKRQHPHNRLTVAALVPLTAATGALAQSIVSLAHQRAHILAYAGQQAGV